MNLADLASELTGDSESWFGKFDDPTVFYALALGGEAGEVQNVVNKRMRGSISQEAMTDLLCGELADVFSYLLLLAHSCGIDLEKALADKRAELYERWGKP